MRAKKNSSDRGADRIPPDREIDKMQAIRHLLHASIRMLFWEEDPFALHLVSQSCDKLIIDCLEADGIKSRIDFADVIRSEYLKEFYRTYRETYNYFKHAREDRKTKLGVRNIIRNNELLIVLNVMRLSEGLYPCTMHMEYFLRYAALIMPGKFNREDLKQIHLDGDLDSIKRSEILAEMRAAVSKDSTYLAEKSEDLMDITASANATIRDYK